MPFQRPRGRSIKDPSTGKGSGNTKEGTQGNHGSIRSGVESSKEGSCKIQEIQQALDCTRDELAAWAVHLQQQQQLTPREKGETLNAMEEPYQAPTNTFNRNGGSSTSTRRFRS